MSCAWTIVTVIYLPALRGELSIHWYASQMEEDPVRERVSVRERACVHVCVKVGETIKSDMYIPDVLVHSRHKTSVIVP